MINDWSLYLVTDPWLGGGPDCVPRIVDAAIRGGTSVVQLRDKDADADTFTARAAELVNTINSRVPLFINDRVETAVELGLHLHIGQGDMPYPVARHLLPHSSMIGVSVENMKQLNTIAQGISAGLRPPDVLGIGPVEQTSTKPDAAAPIGLSGVAELSARARLLGIPCVAIGHVHQGNVADLLHAGAEGVCTVSEIMAAKDPYHASASFRSIINQTRDEHSIHGVRPVHRDHVPIHNVQELS